ncbi:hypothetical protein JA1_005086 [Spathaspora sp. JA1]|nr:hypothetical protein JA1_005086 [Spathaspora sp. JA1]
MQNSSNVHLVKEIVTIGLQPDEYKIIKSFPWIKIILEHEKDLTKFLQVDASFLENLILTSNNYRLINDKILESNYLIKELNIGESDSVPFDIIPKLKGLESLHISPASSDTLLKLGFAGVSKLQIKKLFVYNCFPDCAGGRLFHALKELFNLGGIETFGFSILFNMEYQDLNWTIPHLLNIKNLFIEGRSNDYICNIYVYMVIPYPIRKKETKKGQDPK